MLLKIDGREIEVEPGTKVKDAAMRAGIRIPGLCDHPELEPYGGCRLCLVEIEGVRGFPSSCTMPVSQGMVVRTDTSALRDLRREILEMLLSEHPCNCLFCERAGRCDEIREGMRKAPQAMGCRYCPKDQRCELQETLELIGLEKVELPHIGGEKDLVSSPFFDRDPNLCILCGRCVRACAARGLGVISFTFRGFDAGIGTAFQRPLEESGCRFCGACVDVCPTGALSERAGRWSGRAESVVVTTCPYCSSNCQIGLEVGGGKILRARPAGNSLCVRGRFGLDFVGRDRLKRPLLRKNGRLVEVDWEEALHFAAQGLAGRSGKDFALFTSGVLSNEALFLAQRFAREVMRSDAVAPDVASGFRTPELSAGPLMVVGDLAETNPALELALRSAGPVVISPLETRLARKASLWLRPAPGGEARALAAIAEAMGSEFGSDRPGAGIPGEEMRRAAELLPGAAVLVGPDCSPGVVAAASTAARAAGGRLCLPGRNCNSQGASALGLNRNYPETMQRLLRGSLRAAYLAGCNPVRARPELARALSGLDFLVVQDLFLTETAGLADVVLPAASFAETEGTFTASDGRMLPVRQALQPAGARPDWQILSQLGRRMGARGLEFSDAAELRKAMPACAVPAELPPGFEPDAERQAEVGSPFLLVEGPSLFEFGTGTRTSRVYDLQYLTRERRAEIHPRDASRMGISAGDAICLKTGGESIEAVARISGRVREGSLRLFGRESRVAGAEVRRIV